MFLNTSPETRRSAGGHVLAMVLVVVTICAIALTSYLQLVNAQNRVVARSQGWNASVPVMEAGVEEALAHLNANSETNLNVDGWVQIGNYYRMERAVGDSYYVVTITVTNLLLPVIESRGFCRMPLLVQHNSAPFFLAQASLNTSGDGSYYPNYGGNYSTPRDGYMGRGVRINARKNGSLIKAMLAKGRISIAGDVLVDSFSSCDPNKSTNGRYDPAKATDSGDIASNGQLVNDISITGSAKIKGHISTGPGGAVGVNGNKATVGSDAWHDDGMTGVQPGWFRDDMNANIADSPIPPAGGYTGFPSGGYVNGVYYDWILPSGVYNIAELKLASDRKVLITGEVALKINGDLSMAANSGIHIAPGGRLEMYVNGANASISGQGIVNQTGDARAFTYYGSKNNLRLGLGGDSEFIGVVYAPYAELTIAGGAVIHGGTVSKTVKATGGFTMHYDTCLSKGGQGRYIVTSWDELTPQEVARIP